jgi:predicted regulator of Ras-like GTPase activity (Roadblock/LC7/MglB family)
MINRILGWFFLSFSSINSRSSKNLKTVLTDIVQSLDGIYSGFCVDTDGLLIEEVNLEGTLGKESSLILCSLVAGIQSNMSAIGQEIGSSPWLSFTSESENFKLFLRAVGQIAFVGVLTDPYVDMELLKLVIGPGVDAILEILQHYPSLKQNTDQISGLKNSQKELNALLDMEL